MTATLIEAGRLPTFQNRTYGSWCVEDDAGIIYDFHFEAGTLTASRLMWSDDERDWLPAEMLPDDVALRLARQFDLRHRDGRQLVSAGMEVCS